MYMSQRSYFLDYGKEQQMGLVFSNKYLPRKCTHCRQLENEYLCSMLIHVVSDKFQSNSFNLIQNNKNYLIGK